MIKLLSGSALGYCFFLSFGEFGVVALVLLSGVSVGLAALWKRRTVIVAAFLHLQNFFAVPPVELLYAPPKPQRLRMILKSPVLAQKCADDAVELRVFTQKVLTVELGNWNTPNPNQDAARPKNRRDD
jgi:hypothetical protein